MASASSDPQATWKEQRGVNRPRGPSQAPWHRSPMTRSVLRRLRRPVLIGVLMLGLGVFLGLLIWVATWLRPIKQIRVVFLGSDYQDNLALPIDVYGWSGLQDLANLSTSSQEKRSRSLFGGITWTKPRTYVIGDDWGRDLDKAPEQTVVLFLALHGGTDGEGAYFLPQDATVDPNPDNRLRLTAVLSRLAGLPADKNKVLILDVTQMQANWALGMLTNDFARELEGLNDRIAAIPNLVVISSSGINQRSHVSPEWMQTVFTHFLLKGIQGAAQDVDQSGTISLLELADYVQGNVSRWVWATSQQVQKPVLLPRGDVGRQRAEKIIVSIPQKTETKGDIPEFHVPGDLEQAWQHYRTLSQLVPAPWVNSPVSWRLYQETLLRYEALLCAGSPVAAAKMAARLPPLEQNIRALQRFNLASQQNSLPLISADGAGDASPPAEVVQQFNQLWNAPVTEESKIWSGFQTTTSPAALPLLRIQLYRLLMIHVVGDPATRMNKAVSLLGVLADPLSPRPVEIQFLLLLQRDLPNPPPPISLLRLALGSMIEAEKAALVVIPNGYPYSEQVNPWIQQRLRLADQQRRFGLDLVLASDPDSWTKADSFLREAIQAYEKAQAEGAIVQAALVQRDRAFSILPYYTRWAASQMPRSAEDPNNDPQLPDTVERLWTELYQLSQMLEKPDPNLLVTTTIPGANKSLAAQAALVDQTLDQLENRFNIYCIRLLRSNDPSVTDDVSEALLLPQIEPGIRMQLISKGRSVSRQLVLSTRASGTLLLDVPATAQAALDEQVRFEAGIQGRMALAWLGRKWFDQGVAPGEENYLQARHRLDTFMVENAWWLSVAKVGEQVGQSVRRIPGEINRLMDRSMTLADADAVTILVQADQLERMYEGGEPLQMMREQESSLRRHRFSDMLNWLAGRLLEDHWYGLNTTGDPYYRVAGLLYTGDARRLLSDSNARLESLDALQRKLNQDSRLSLEGQLRYEITSQRRFRIAYQLRTPGDNSVYPGYPVFWFTADKQLQVISPRGNNRVLRQLGTPGSDATRTITCDVTSSIVDDAEKAFPPIPQVSTSKLQVMGRFRGQEITRQTLVDLYPTPDNILHRYPLPLTGSVAVRTTEELRQIYGASSGSIALILDCSGSMGPLEGQAWGPTTKYNEATRALRNVLQQLPRGVTVSLWVFGQAVGSNKTVAKPEATIQQIQAPFTWDPDNAAQLRDLMAKVEYPALEPWNESPIVASLVKAREDLRAAKGFKTIVAITDGRDNRFATDRQLNPDGLDISAFLTKTFRDSGIVVNIIAFKLATPADRQIKDQFKVVEQLPLPGKLIEVNDAEELGGTLQKSTRQAIRFGLDRVDNVPLASPLAELASSTLEGFDQWYPGGLPPAVYKLRALTDQRIEKEIAINRGALLLVDLVQTSTGGVFRRALYSQSRFPTRPAVDRSGWRAAALQNQQTGAASLEMMVTLEKKPDAREDLLQVLFPRWTWIETQPSTGNQTPYSQHWGNLSGYPAPAWDLRVPAWPGADGQSQPARPQVKIWWNPDQDMLPSATLDRNADFRLPNDIVSRALLVDVEEVRVDSVMFEDHLVEVQPGVTETQPCMVVRVRHPSNKPVWAQVRGVGAVGQEHRFYYAAGQYTGLFWPVSAQQGELGLQQVSLYSLNLFKQEAERRGFSLDMTNLGVPDSADVRPRPPVNLR